MKHLLIAATACGDFPRTAHSRQKFLSASATTPYSASCAECCGGRSKLAALWYRGLCSPVCDCRRTSARLVGTLSFVSSSELGIGMRTSSNGHDAGNRFLDHIDDHGFDRTRCWPPLTRSCPRGYAAAARPRIRTKTPSQPSRRAWPSCRSWCEGDCNLWRRFVVGCCHIDTVFHHTTR